MQVTSQTVALSARQNERASTTLKSVRDPSAQNVLLDTLARKESVKYAHRARTQTLITR